ncbi:MAG: hypothetical protein P8M11_00660 [Planctomycetota bacterium]|nr:hypothetical protein [Planctomycetota bacterium]MDG1983053.1 hypothetical protein [Planctomycetota bacterium]
MIRLALHVLFAPLALASAQTDFVHWETPHVSPVALDAASQRLLVCNTPDARLEVLDVSNGVPVPLTSIPVGLDPVSVRLRGGDEAWVVNSISDSISVVDLSSGSVVRTIRTADEPADVVFAGNPVRAFVSCSQPNLVQVFDPDAPGAPLAEVPLRAEEPRAMAVSPDGSTVHVAIFESGNGSTILAGGADLNNGTPEIPNVVSDPTGPYGGQNPPPNDGASFAPAMRPGNPAPPAVGLIVKHDGQGRWMDDNGGNWTDLVSGPDAARSGRPVGWRMADRDVASIDAQSLTVTYSGGLMNINMALAVHPVSESVTVVGTDGTNETRFEPNLDGVFLRVRLATVATSGSTTLVDLNPHLDYSTSGVPQAERDLAVGDPRGIAWRADGGRAYITGMGSNNVVAIDATGARVGAPIEVGEGPTGIALDAAGQRAFVVNKFDASVSVVDLVQGRETVRVPFHDPSPEVIKVGRRHLYDTHAGSGLGHVACASCHVDSRTDRLAWDLGDPSAPMDSDSGLNLGMGLPGMTTGFEDFHPMKGPMTTQTLQDIIGKEPLHWRGDKDSLHDFAGAFVGLQGDDAPPSRADIDEFEAFLATVSFPPNPFRGPGNALPTDLPLPDHFSPGRFSPAGTPLPNGDAQAALGLYLPPVLLDRGALACVTCHTLPTGLGPNMRLQGFTYAPIPEGPEGEAHHGLVSTDGSTNVNMKISQLRNMHEKVGMDFTQAESLSGFGFLHDGSIPSMAAFLAVETFDFQNDQQLADMVALMMSFAGSDLPNGSVNSIMFPPGTASLDTHAGVGIQLTLEDVASAAQEDLDLLLLLANEAELGRIGLVGHGLIGGVRRGAVYEQGGTIQTDRAGESMATAAFLALATPGTPLTMTAVPVGTQQRIGVDRDADGFLDQDERDAGSDPANPSSVPSIGTNYCGPAVANASGAPGRIAAIGSPVAADGDLRLSATSLPAQSAGYFVGSMTQGFVPNPGGSVGNLCIAGDVARFAAQLRSTGATGSFSIEVDLTSIPTNPGQPVLAGQTWNFQAWFRDSAGGQATSNFTDGISIPFQ